jgi:predicted Rdx family selenoprotein|tara:strand:- start:871 stop:987 length:117 start_codon:yes stop_codon:yes gene_type:complete
LIGGGAGMFEITVDSALKFSKTQVGRFPEDDEVRALVS